MSGQVKAQADDASEQSATEGTAEPELPAEDGCAMTACIVSHVFMRPLTLHDNALQPVWGCGGTGRGSCGGGRHPGRSHRGCRHQQRGAVPAKPLSHPMQILGSPTASAKRALSCIIIRSTFDRMCTCLSCSCALYMVVKRTYVIEARL